MHTIISKFCPYELITSSLFEEDDYAYFDLNYSLDIHYAKSNIDDHLETFFKKSSFVADLIELLKNKHVLEFDLIKSISENIKDEITNSSVLDYITNPDLNTTIQFGYVDVTHGICTITSRISGGATIKLLKTISESLMNKMNVEVHTAVCTIHGNPK